LFVAPPGFRTPALLTPHFVWGYAISALARSVAKNLHRRWPEAAQRQPIHFSTDDFPMNTNLLDKPIVLSLNRAWQVIGHRTVKQALVALNGGGDDLPPALGLDIAYPKLEDGSWNFDRPLFLNPIPWEEWTQLPVRDFDFVVTTPKLRIRVPTVIISTQFNKMPVRVPRLSRQTIFERDAGVCQYTGEYVGRSGGNLDHVVPRDRGGRDTFENLVWAKKEINSLKANRLPHEAGLRLLRRPKTPASLPMAAAIREAKHPDWRHFLTH
jgi:5-methylcytosine-specific restriction endonuclease McrA